MLTPQQYRQAEFGYTLEESKKGFKAHATVFGFVMTFLIALNVCLIVFTGANFPWAIFPLIGWSTGLTFHYVYGYRRASEAARLRQHKIEAYAERAEELV